MKLKNPQWLSLLLLTLLALPAQAENICANALVYLTQKDLTPYAKYKTPTISEDQIEAIPQMQQGLK